MRTRESFCDNWKFHRGDIKTERSKIKWPIYTQSKTERYRTGPASILYSDIPRDYEANEAYPTEHWEYVRLPHDYVIDGTPNIEENETLGYLKYDNAWYRKSFFLPAEDDGKRIIIEFEGCSGEATVYLNGCLMKHNYSGYTSFQVDITDYAVCGGENLLAVYINLESFEGWWYEGGGIYRNVWLLKTDEIAVDTYGVYINPKKISDSIWRAELEATLVSKASNEESVEIQTEIIDKNGKTVARAGTCMAVPSHSKATVKYYTDVDSPHLWDIDDPYLYDIKTTVIRSGKVCDEYYTRTGFRYFKCDPEKGFFLNGRHVKIKGVCAHEDCGLLGKAVPANVHRYKMELLKEMGANGYRTSHYQQNTAILDSLDELGFIVLNEARWFSSTDEGIAQLEELVKRDRNRPSVFFWSLSNEEYYHTTEQGRKISKSLMRALRRLDSSRPVTSAVNRGHEKATVFDELDFIGVNYTWEVYELLHKKFPDKAILSSENGATGTSRSWYIPDRHDKAYLSSYDKDTTDRYKSREYTWKFIDSRDWMMGGYQWAGFEHRGETVWPRLCSQSGAIDLFLQKKDAFYQNRSHWSEKPNIHMLPHWNVESYDGEPVKVWIYTNCEEAELILNGKSLGRKPVEKHTHLEWVVDYEPGKIQAIGYNQGEIAATECHETAGEPKALMLRLENKVCGADDIAIITCYTVDGEGRLVPNASPTVSFHANPFGRIISTGSDICDHTPLFSPIRKMREGYISVTAGIAITEGHPVGEHGTVEVYAHADGLKSARLKIEF
jgi:beta-galactosidase